MTFPPFLSQGWGAGRDVLPHFAIQVKKALRESLEELDLCSLEFGGLVSEL